MKSQKCLPLIRARQSVHCRSARHPCVVPDLRDDNILLGLIKKNLMVIRSSFSLNIKKRIGQNVLNFK